MRRGVSLALMSLAFMLTATASAAADYQVLVVRAERRRLEGGHRCHPLGRQVGRLLGDRSLAGRRRRPVHGREARALQRRRVPQHGRAQHADRRAAGGFEEYFHDGGGFVGIGSAIETDPSWQFLTDILGTRASGRTAAQSGTVKVADRVHAASEEPAGVLEPHGPLVQLHGERPGRLARARHRRRGSLRPAAAGPSLDGIAGGTMGFDHPISWCKDYRGGRSFYTGARQHRRRASTRDLHDAPEGRDQLGGRPSDPVYSDCGATVLANYQQTRSRRRRTSTSRSASTCCPTGGSSRPPAAAAVRLHDPATSTTQISPTSPPRSCRSRSGLHEHRGRHVRPGDRQRLRHRTSGSTSTTRRRPSPTSSCRRASRHADDADDQLAEQRADRRRAGIRGSATSSSPGSSSSRTRARDASTWRSEQQILRVSSNRQECCHVAGDIDFDTHNNLWLVTGDDTPAGGSNAGGLGPFNDQLTDEQQTVRAPGRDRRHVHADLQGPDDRAAAVRRDRRADRLGARGAQHGRRRTTSRSPAGRSTRPPRRPACYFRRALQQADQPQLTGDGAAPHRCDAGDRHGAGGRLVPAPVRRRPPRRAEHQRPARQDAADQGQGR